MAEDLEATRRKRKRMKHLEQEEVTAASSESPRPPATPDSKPESPAPVAPETLTATGMARGKGRASKKQEVVAASPLVEEAVTMEEKKKRKRSRHVEAAAIPSPSAATANILEVAEKGVAARKEQRQGKVAHEQSGQLPFPIDVHPQGGKPAVNGAVSDSQSFMYNRFGKLRVLSNKELIKHKIKLLNQNPEHQVVIPTIVNLDSIDHDPKYASPYGAFLDRFSYKPDRQQGRSAPSLPKTPDLPARPVPRDHLSSRSSQVTANRTFMGAKKATSIRKQPRSASASGPQKERKVEGKEMPEKKPRKSAPALCAAEKRSDVYRRLPLNQLVRPPRSPHKLLQEKYASDPWKVMVICMLLNMTQGKQVRKKVKGLFKRYPDAQTAYTADPEKMAEYLAPLGLQRVKTKRIQKFSKAYLQEEWTHVTQLCGVGKYAADAYAIFCAGRAADVVPHDHKLVDYWKYVCFDLPLIQASQNAQDVGVTGQGSAAPEVKQVAVSS